MVELTTYDRRKIIDIAIELRYVAARTRYKHPAIGEAVKLLESIVKVRKDPHAWVTIYNRA